MSSNKLLINKYQEIRKKTETLCFPLVVEDYVIQSIDDVSPPKWHLAHTTWFFETFILLKFVKKYHSYHSLFQYLFNSYYQTIGQPYPRIKRGLLSRPTVKEIYQYRQYIDEQIIYFLDSLSEDEVKSIQAILILGLEHEQQHQELLLMDIKHNFSIDPSLPSYQENNFEKYLLKQTELKFLPINGGLVTLGHASQNNFCFDNELPLHEVVLKPYQIANRLITNQEFSEFIQAGGYQRPEYWLADGWDCVQKNAWFAPLYWHFKENEWHIFTLQGLTSLKPAEPVSHISYYEAEAYARFKGARLASEAEWENTIQYFNIKSHHGHFLEKNVLHPMPVVKADQPQQLFGDLWEWTASSYCPYPGYKPLRGELGEYNGKFMSNQIVLRGGSCITPASHIRATYRNFFQLDKRWQFSGIRLAKDE